MSTSSSSSPSVAASAAAVARCPGSRTRRYVVVTGYQRSRRWRRRLTCAWRTRRDGHRARPRRGSTHRASMQNWRTASRPRSATNPAAPAVWLCCGPSRLRPQRPTDCSSSAWCCVCHARQDADGRCRDNELDDDRCPHRGNHCHRLAARARRGVVVAHCRAGDSSRTRKLDGTLGRRPASLDHQLADVAVDCAGVRARGATRSTGRSLTRAEVAGAFLFLIHALPTRGTVCCWHAPRVTLSCLHHLKEKLS